MQATQLTRDSFGRQTLMRIKCPPDRTCDWCGQPARWQYGWVTDSVHPQPIAYSRPMCSVQCYRNFMR